MRAVCMGSGLVPLALRFLIYACKCAQQHCGPLELAPYNGFAAEYARTMASPEQHALALR